MQSKRILGEPLNATQVMNLWMNSPVLSDKRSPNGAQDFGDAETVGLHLKRRYLKFMEFQESLDFAAFLGEHDGRWIVGILDGSCSRLISGESFDSLEDLKEAWELD